jgi:hypothetical protein
MSEEPIQVLPECATDYIDLVVKKVCYRRKVRADVRQELTSHFEEALRKCTSDAERDESARNLIAEFGDPKVLAKLIRRGKKRCRPLWLKAFIRTCQVIGIVLLLIIIRTAGLYFGTPGHAIDHYAKLTELGRGGLDDSQNASLVLDKAASVMVVTPKWLWDKLPHLPLDMNDVELTQLRDWLASNTEALDLLRAASAMPGRWATYRPMPPDANIPAWMGKRFGGMVFSNSVVQQTMPELSNFRELVYMLRWHCLYEAQEGHTAVAIDDAITVVRLGAFYEDKGLLVDNLVGIAIEGMGETLLYKVVATGKCDTSLLADAQAQLQQLYSQHPTTVGLSGEKVIWDEIVQSSYTDSGRMLSHGIPFLCRDWTSSLKGFVFGFPSKTESQKQVDDYFGLLEETARKTPWQQRIEAATYEKRLAESGTFMLRFTGPSIAHADLGWQAKTKRGATLAILAIKRFELDKGSLPESLDALVAAGYLSSLPMDPWSDKPLVYRKTADDYTLYSVGYDFKDDGGIPKPKGKSQETPGCDIVFWPIR